MTGSGNDKHIEILTGLNQSLSHTVCMCRIHVLIHISGYKHQVSFQILGYLCIRLYSKLVFIFFGLVTQTVFHHLLYFSYTIVTFSPTTVIDTIIMVSGTRNGSLIKVRISADSSRSHKSATGMSVDTNFLTVNKRVALSQLLNSILIIFQRIITHIAVTVTVICLSTHRSISPMAYSDYNKAKLRHTGTIAIIQRKVSRNEPEVWSRINNRNNRIFLFRIKIRRLPHHSIQIRNIIGSFHHKIFRLLPTGGIY